MAKVNSLFQDKQEKQIADWLAENPGKTEEEAYYALRMDENDKGE